MGELDFSISSIMLSSIVIGAGFPLLLIVVVRIPLLARRVGLQFLISSLFTVFLWVSFVAFMVSDYSLPLLTEIAISSMILFSFLIVYLEIWALLTNGYTLGLLLTLLKTGHPVNEHEFSKRYRNNEGVSWVIEHRLTRLIAAGLIKKVHSGLVISPVSGSTVASLYKLGIVILGLQKGK